MEQVTGEVMTYRPVLQEDVELLQPLLDDELDIVGGEDGPLEVHDGGDLV